MRARAALLRQAREFFFSRMVGLYNWDNVKIAPAEEHPEVDGRRVLARSIGLKDKILADSKYREMARIAFSPWEIIALSSEEHPPCGLVTLRFGDIMSETVISGPLDHDTWRRVGDAILAKQTTNHREINYGQR